jgi:hypothetical protein
MADVSGWLPELIGLNAEIQDDAGETATRRAIVQFPGATVTDDPLLGRTVISLTAGLVETGNILHSAGAAVGNVVTTTAVEGTYQLATAANLSTDRSPSWLITALTVGATYDTITIARGGIWDASITGLSAADPGYVRLDTATATLVRDNTISDTEWLMGWADPVPLFTLVIPARPGLGGGSNTLSVPYAIRTANPDSVVTGTFLCIISFL